MLVSDIDEPVVAAATRTPFEARRRVFVIERAETMNDQAANRMLKTLEEPADFAHLVLLTDRPGEVLPTIASRCQHVRFDAPSADEIAARLHGHRPGHRAGVRAPGPRRRRARARGWPSATGRSCARAPRPSRAARCTTSWPSARGWRSSRAPRRCGDAAQAEVEARVAEELELPAHARAQARRARGRRGGQARRPPRARRRAGPGAAARRPVVPRRGRAWPTAHPRSSTPSIASTRCAPTPRAATRTRCARAVEHVDDARALLILNPSEELLLEALAYRLARVLSAR